MKKILLILLPAAALTAVLAWYFWTSRPMPPSVGAPEPAAAPRSGPPPTRTSADPAAVFKKAFWREPSAGDRIDHSERNGWSDGEGITKWEWFIEVTASPELVKYLRDDNSFGLIRAKSASMPEGRPPWFTFDPAAVSVFKSPRGNLQLIFSNQGRKLFACDSGRGFQRGAAAPAAQPSQTPPSAPPGRLPTTPPPNPRP